MRPEYIDRDIVYVDLGDQIRSGDPEKILETIDRSIAEVMPQRIVIDPITVVGEMLKKDYRSFLFDLSNHLKHWNATTLVTGEVQPGELYPPEIAYTVDGIVLLLLCDEHGDRRKYLEVLKMRGTAHSSGRHSIDISRKEGLVVLKARF
jgi:circadian clock protein KaiC